MDCEKRGRHNFKAVRVDLETYQEIKRVSKRTHRSMCQVVRLFVLGIEDDHRFQRRSVVQGDRPHAQ